MHFVFGSTNIAITHSDSTLALAEVAGHLKDGRGFALATLNLDHLVKLRTNAAFRMSYAAQEIVVADGNPIVWLSRLARIPVSLVTGSDLVTPLVNLATELGRPVVLFGSCDPALAGAEVALRAQVPGIVIVHTIAPAYDFDPTGPAAKAILAQIAAVGPCLCLVALGAPKQEQFAALGRSLAPQAGFASIGAGLDFLSGHQQRAPDWTRRFAMEWLWRTVQSPKRMVPRYLGCAAILPGQAWRAWRMRDEGHLYSIKALRLRRIRPHQ